MDYFSWLKTSRTVTMDESIGDLKKTLAEHEKTCVAKRDENCPYKRKIESAIEAKEAEVEKADLVDPSMGNVTEANSASAEPAEQPKRDKHDFAMSPKKCEQMIKRAFVIGDIRGYYGYTTPQEWFREEGPEGVAEIVDNYYELASEYVNPIVDEIDSIQDVLESYKRGTLVGPSERHDEAKEEFQQIDISSSTRVKDERFYSPQYVEATKEDYALACRKAVGPDKQKIQDARAKVVMFSHNRSACELLGISQKEMNGKLRSWAAYPSSAMELSHRLNDGVGEGAQWFGLENSSCLWKWNAQEQDISKLVREIGGNPSDYQKNYITRTMLAIDTHTDFSPLAFEFTGERIVTGRNNDCRGVYIPTEKKIRVSNASGLHTVAHEMGHYLDRQWAAELGMPRFASMTNIDGVSDAIKNKDPEVARFCKDFSDLMSDLNDSADETSAYTLDKGEIFARFVAKFVEWTEEKSVTANRVFRETVFYNDRFNQGQFEKFVKILQEKAHLDAKRMAAK